VTSTGTEAVHNLSGAVKVTIALTEAQIAAIKASSNPHIYYYDADTGAFTDMNATFDMTAGTATFTTNHFSTYVIATTTAAASTIGVTYASHVQSSGWLPYVSDGALSGTTGKSRRLEAFNIKPARQSPIRPMCRTLAGSSPCQTARLRELPANP
jgi:uncharacterized protein YjdB